MNLGSGGAVKSKYKRRFKGAATGLSVGAAQGVRGPDSRKKAAPTKLFIWTLYFNIKTVIIC